MGIDANNNVEGDFKNEAEQFLANCLAKAVVARKLNIPVKGISSEGLIIDWDKLLATEEITPDLVRRFLTVLAAPGKAANAQVFQEKLEKLPEDKKKEIAKAVQAGVGITPKDKP